MNPIKSVGVTNSVAKVQSTAPASTPERPVESTVARGADRLELSGVQNYLQVLRSNDIRVDKVAEVKAQIEAGTYETEEKLDIAADRLLDDLS